MQQHWHSESSQLVHPRPVRTHAPLLVQKCERAGSSQHPMPSQMLSQCASTASAAATDGEAGYTSASSHTSSNTSNASAAGASHHSTRMLTWLPAQTHTGTQTLRVHGHLQRQSVVNAAYPGATFRPVQQQQQQQTPHSNASERVSQGVLRARAVSEPQPQSSQAYAPPVTQPVRRSWRDLLARAVQLLEQHGRHSSGIEHVVRCLAAEANRGIGGASKFLSRLISVADVPEKNGRDTCRDNYLVGLQDIGLLHRLVVATAEIRQRDGLSRINSLLLTIRRDNCEKPASGGKEPKRHRNLKTIADSAGASELKRSDKVPRKSPRRAKRRRLSASFPTSISQGRTRSLSLPTSNDEKSQASTNMSPQNRRFAVDFGEFFGHVCVSDETEETSAAAQDAKCIVVQSDRRPMSATSEVSLTSTSATTSATSEAIRAPFIRSLLEQHNCSNPLVKLSSCFDHSEGPYATDGRESVPALVSVWENLDVVSDYSSLPDKELEDDLLLLRVPSPPLNCQWPF
ncbi:MAG: hypothetical protein MHM6MM_000473 [Cercozoa sp. M6MM]